MWSPDGARLVTVVRTGGKDEGSQQEKPKTPPARLITRLKYRANGEGFTYDRRRHLFVVDVATVGPASSPRGIGTTPSPPGRRKAAA
jgi:hypothetical protein